MGVRAWYLAIVLACLALYVPCTGSYGLWDPWETHYSEVARELLINDDWVSLEWRGTPYEKEFWSKPPLAMWGQAIGLAISGVDLEHGAALASSSRPEWAVRLPSVACSLLALWAIAFATSRLINRRAATYATAVCATCPLFSFIAHQAITDMYLVGTITAAICLVAVALFDPDDRPPGWLTWLGAGSLIAVVAPQLYALGCRVSVVEVVPYLLALGALVVRIVRARTRTHALLHVAFVLAGLSILAKGVLGVGIAVVTIGLYLLVTRELGRLRSLRPLDALATIAVVAMPWHHAMTSLHGTPFLRTLLLEHQLGRVSEGESGTLSYFARELAYGTLPWIPVAIAAVLAMLASRARVLWFVAIWLFVAHGVVAASATKFHHYILPAVPPLAIACGWFLDRCRSGEVSVRERIGLYVGAPIALLAGLALVISQHAPEKLFWLFTYDYVMGGMPWPDDLELRPALVVVTVTSIGASLVIARRAAVPVLIGSAIACTAYLQWIVMPRASTSWSQKESIDLVYHQPPGQLYAVWLNLRGETFYTANQLTAAIPFEGGLTGFRERHPGEPIYVLTPDRHADLLAQSFPGAHVLETPNTHVKVVVVPPARR